MIVVNWKGENVFEVNPPSGGRFVMDSPADDSTPTQGPSPVEAFLSAAAACSGIDVVSILKKQRQVLTGYRIEVEWTRGPEGEYPRPVLSVSLRHILTGEALDLAAVKRAVELSDTKYCTVAATLRHGPTVTCEFVIA